jgi:hypothetical protein
MEFFSIQLGQHSYFQRSPSMGFYPFFQMSFHMFGCTTIGLDLVLG